MARAEKMWMVYAGTILDTVHGGGLEFIGPFGNEKEAVAYTVRLAKLKPTDRTFTCGAVKLLRPAKESYD